MKRNTRAGRLILGAAMATASSIAIAQFAVEAPTPAVSMPRPHEVSEKDRGEIRKALADRFGTQPTKELKFRAAGPFRFAGTKTFLYIDRTDLNSVAFESSAYGTAAKALEPASTSKEALLPRIEGALRKSRVEAGDREFSEFQDEFSGAAPKKDLPKDFDPRKTSLHVARTASFKRVVEGVPIFGSELVAGLNPDGTIGRLRVHWPRIEPELVKEAQRLQAAVKEQKWEPPPYLKDPDTEILEVQAGVGHSGFADPGFRSAAVVRVLVRRVARGVEHPISSTSYKFFDAANREVHFSVFPKVPGTPAEKKPKEKPPAGQ